MSEIKLRHLGHYTLRESAQDVPQQDPPDWQGVSILQISTDRNQPPNGIVRQRCGGGYRIVRKRIGNN